MKDKFTCETAGNDTKQLASPVSEQEDKSRQVIEAAKSAKSAGRLRLEQPRRKYDLVYEVALILHICSTLPGGSRLSGRASVNMRRFARWLSSYISVPPLPGASRLSGRVNA